MNDLANAGELSRQVFPTATFGDVLRFTDSDMLLSL